MSQVFDFSGVGDFCTGGLLYPNPKQQSVFPKRNSRVDVYLTPRKKSRVYAPFVVSGETKKQPSIEVLPDECLFEIFRRIPGGQERTSCAGVSKRWLKLLSTIRREEICGLETDDRKEDGGFLSRSLEGKKATDLRLAAIAVGTAGRGGLGKLSIAGSSATRGLTNSGLKAISHSCPSLRVLSLLNLSSIGDEGLCEIASGVHSLEKLNLSHCSSVTDTGLIAIAMNSPNLVSVTLESCPKVANDSLQALGRYCPNLKNVTIKNCPLVGDQGIASLLSSAGHVLTTAKFQGLNISDVALAVIGHYGKAMTDLTLIGLQKVNERGFWVMGKGQGLQNLKSLSVIACGGVSDLGLEAIAKGCPDLKMFVLKKCPLVSDNGVTAFSIAAQALETLQLEECHRLTQFGVFGVLVNSGEKLKALALTNCLGIRDLGVAFPVASLCHSIRSLTIRNCPGFGDFGLAMVGKLCPKLTHIDVGLQGVSDSGLFTLVQRSVASLEKVNLSGCVNLTDNVVNAIATIHGETLERLILDGCRNITDMSLMAIAKSCSVLGELDVSQSRITDFGISLLASATQLNMKILSLSGCTFLSDKSSPFLNVIGKTLLGLNIYNCSGISHNTICQLIEDLWRCNILS